jgi:hypothetical protein
MRKALVAFALAVLVAVPAFAGPPVNGNYFPQSFPGGFVLNGAFSECYVGGGQGMVNNTVHALSSDGGIQWGVSCPILATATKIEDTVVGGYGHRTWRTVYAGGTFWLTGAAPWGSGDALYPGTIDMYVHITTFQYAGDPNNWISYRTNAELQGHFVNYPETCIAIAIANATLFGVGAVPPVGYPPFKNGSAGTCVYSTGIPGEWGIVYDVQISIGGCITSSETTTWGAIKTLYR